MSRFVAVVGPSGSGKSSLVRAGLVPALRRGALPGSREWDTRDSSRPGDSAGSSTAPSIGTRRRLTSIVDHLEELFTAGRDERGAGRLPRRARSGRRPTPDGSANVVVAFRGDSYDRFAAFPPFARLLAESQLLVGPMTDAEVHAAIEEPAHRAALTLEARLADAIAADVAGQPGALPLLSTALLQTWVRRRGRVLTHAGYHDAGGVGGAVAGLAEDTYLQFTPDEQRVCRLLLMRLAEPGEGPTTCAGAFPLAELGEPASSEVLETLVARRLVTTGDGTAEVAHEALLREWPRLRGWLEEDRDGRRLHHRVAAAAIEWDAAGRDPTELYRGTRLDAALDWSAAHPGEANPLEREFLEAGRRRAGPRAANRAPHGSPAALAHRRPRRPAGRRRSSPARSRSSSAATPTGRPPAPTTPPQSHRRPRLATLARTLPANRNDLALLLGVEAPAAASRRSRPTAASKPRSPTGPPGSSASCTSTRPLRTRTLSDDRRLIAAPGNDGNVRIYDFATGRLRRTLRGNGEPAFVSLFNADASLVVTGGIHGKITIWRVATGKPIGPPINAGRERRLRRVHRRDRPLHRERHGSLRPVGLPRPEASESRSANSSRSRSGANDVPVAAFGGGPDRNLMAAAGSSSQHTTIFDVRDAPTRSRTSTARPGASAPTAAPSRPRWTIVSCSGTSSTGAERGDLSLGSHLAAERRPGSARTAACSSAVGSGRRTRSASSTSPPASRVGDRC